MKIEIGESLAASWLKHIKNCQLIETNWKAGGWELKHSEDAEIIFQYVKKYFFDKYSYDIFGSNNLQQLIQQGEVDVVAMNFDNGTTKLYAVEVAYHEAGLNYGSRQETVARIIKKIFRTIFSLVGYFDLVEGDIIFMSPKINNAVQIDLEKALNEIKNILLRFCVNFNVDIISNERYVNEVLQPVVEKCDSISDTNELFVRSLQLLKMFYVDNSSSANNVLIQKIKNTNQRVLGKEKEEVAATHDDRFADMKVGEIARYKLAPLLTSGRIDSAEIEKFQNAAYCKKILDINYPLLLEKDGSNLNRPLRYYSNVLHIKGTDFYMCSEWFEGANNDDRPYLLEFLQKYGI